jgi:hypothetical protein
MLPIILFCGPMNGIQLFYDITHGAFYTDDFL